MSTIDLPPPSPLTANEVYVWPGHDDDEQSLHHIQSTNDETIRTSDDDDDPQNAIHTTYTRIHDLLSESARTINIMMIMPASYHA